MYFILAAIVLSLIAFSVTGYVRTWVLHVLGASVYLLFATGVFHVWEQVAPL